jgi:serine/threonine protein kinase
MKKMDHPNIVKLFDVFDVDNHIVLVMELMDGGNLGKKIKRGAFEEQDALKVVHSIFEAIAYMHRFNVVHRDLKPANIMFKKVLGGVEEGDLEMEEMKLIDFGLCANLKDHSATSLLNDKSGTVGYLAPELITKKRGEFYDAKVDVFSVGMIFYEM